MLFFLGMESSAFKPLMDHIEKIAGVVAQHRGEYAAALWLASDYLADLPGCLVPFRDSKALGGGCRLALRREPPAFSEAGGEPQEGLDSQASGWALFLEGEDWKVPAWEASPPLSVEAVERLPQFLEEYAAHLCTAAGTKPSLEQARGLIDAIYELTSAATGR
jgi:hypothetical protein